MLYFWPSELLTMPRPIREATSVEEVKLHGLGTSFIVLRETSSQHFRPLG